MLKLVIIDDEYMIIEAIRALIDWDRMGIRVVGDAQDGMHGLETIKSEKPDIVMTDIRMPGIDGITLIEKAKAFIPDAAFIIFSGYCEFEYAKAAISLGVIDYLEKPISQEKVEETLLKAKGVLGYRKKSELVFMNAQKKLAENMIHNLINGKGTTEDRLFQLLKEQDIDLYMINEILVCSGQFDEIPEDRMGTYEKMEMYLSDIMEKGKFQYYFLKDSINFIIVVFNLVHSGSSQKIAESLRSFLLCCKEENIHISLGLGQSYPYLINVYHSYIESKKALRYCQFMDGLDLIDINHIEYNACVPTALRLDDDSIVYNIRVGNKEQIISQTKNFMNVLQNYNISPDVFCHECLKLIYLAVKIAGETGKSYEAGSGADFFPHIEIQSKKTLNEVYDWVIATIGNILDWIVASKNTSGRKSILRVKEYLEKNYNKDISLLELADLVNMNANYLSILFKEETGMTYLKYLTKIRMEHARILLGQDNKIQQVSQAVGYYNYRHFSQLFKKYFGVMPNEYKGNIRGGIKNI